MTVKAVPEVVRTFSDFEVTWQEVDSAQPPEGAEVKEAHLEKHLLHSPHTLHPALAVAAAVYLLQTFLPALYSQLFVSAEVEVVSEFQRAFAADLPPKVADIAVAALY